MSNNESRIFLAINVVVVKMWCSAGSHTLTIVQEYNWAVVPAISRPVKFAT